MVKKSATRVSLNVKGPEAHRLARQIAAQTGETLTQAVITALRERQERIGGRDNDVLAADLRAISRRASAGIRRPYLDHGQFLYDERGLPK